MKKYILKCLNRLLFAFLVIGSSYMGYSQISHPGGVDDEDPQAPIDGFLGVGLIVGTAYGAYKLLRKEK